MRADFVVDRDEAGPSFQLSCFDFRDGRNGGGEVMGGEDLGHCSLECSLCREGEGSTFLSDGTGESPSETLVGELAPSGT